MEWRQPINLYLVWIPSCSATALPIKGLKFWRFDNTISDFLPILTAHVQKRLLTSFRSNIWPRHSLRQPRFPIRPMHFHYRVTFTGYTWCFCATASHDLVTLIFDLLTLRVSHVRPTYQFLLSYDYRLLSYEYWIFDHIPVIWNSHCACAVSRVL